MLLKEVLVHYHIQISSNQKIYISDLIKNLIPTIAKRKNQNLYGAFHFESKNRYVAAYNIEGEELHSNQNPKTKAFFYQPWESQIN